MIKKTAFSLFLSAFLFSSAIFAGTEVPKRPGLNELEAVVKKARDFDDFIYNEPLLKEYYQALQNYFGKEKVPEASFKAIVEQLRDLSQKIPEIKNRLWDEVKGVETGKYFSIESQVQTYGRNLNIGKWKGVLSNSSAQPQKNPWMNQAPGQDHAAAISQAGFDIKKRINDFYESPTYKAANQAAKSKLEAEFQVSLRGERKLLDLAEFYTFRVFESERVKDLLGSGDPDLILDTLKDMRQNTRKYVPNGVDLPGPLISEIRKHVPDPAELLKDQDLFPIKLVQSKRGKMVPVGSGSSVYEFKPTPRRIHSIWKGIPISECVGGNCRSLESLTPERWATAAIKDSQFHFVEKDGHFAGFVEATPGKIGNKTYASVGLGSVDLRSPVKYSDPITGEAKQATLFELWLKKANQQKRSNWTGYVVSASNAADNTGVLDTVRNSAAYHLGRETALVPREGRLEIFEFSDPMTKRIIQASPRLGHAAEYGGNMIVDASTPQARAAGGLKALFPILDNEAQDPKVVQKILNGSNHQLKEGIFNYYSSRKNPPNESIVEIFRKIALDPVHPLKGKALGFLISLDPEVRDEKLRDLVARQIRSELGASKAIEGKAIEKISPTLEMLAKKSNGAGNAFTLIEELNHEFPDARVHRVYLNLARPSALAEGVLVKYIARYPGEATDEVLGRLLKSFEVHLDAVTLLRDYEKELSQAKDEATQMFWIKNMARVSRVTKDMSRGPKIRDEFLTRVQNFLNAKKDLTGDFIIELDKTVGPSVYFGYDHLREEKFPKSLGNFFLDPRKEVRNAAISYKQTAYRHVLPSAWGSELVPTREFAEQFVKGQYREVFEKLIRADEFRRVTYEGGLEELLSFAQPQDRRFSEEVFRLLSAHSDHERSLGSWVFRYANTFGQHEDYWIRAARSSDDMSINLKVFEKIAANYRGKPMELSPGFKKWAEELAFMPNKEFSSVVREILHTNNLESSVPLPKLTVVDTCEKSVSGIRAWLKRFAVGTK